jgi:hypothetical protein
MDLVLCRKKLSLWGQSKPLLSKKCWLFFWVCSFKGCLDWRRQWGTQWKKHCNLTSSAQHAMANLNKSRTACRRLQLKQCLCWPRRALKAPRHLHHAHVHVHVHCIMSMSIASCPCPLSIASCPCPCPLHHVHCPLHHFHVHCPLHHVHVT